MTSLTFWDRRNIAQRFRQTLGAKPDRSDDPGLHDKLAFLWSADGATRDGIPEDALTEQGCADPDQDEIAIIPDVAQARVFLVEREDFLWLLERIKTATAMMATDTVDTDVRASLIDMMRHGSTRDLRMDWTPVRFANEQYGRSNDLQLSSVICISGSGPNVQGSTCGDYVSRMWPRFGSDMLLCFTKAMQNGFGTRQGEFAAD